MLRQWLYTEQTTGSGERGSRALWSRMWILGLITVLLPCFSCVISGKFGSQSLDSFNWKMRVIISTITEGALKT